MVNKQLLFVNGNYQQHRHTEQIADGKDLLWLTFIRRWFTTYLILQTRPDNAEDLPTFSG